MLYMIKPKDSTYLGPSNHITPEFLCAGFSYCVRESEKDSRQFVDAD